MFFASQFHKEAIFKADTFENKTFFWFIYFDSTVDFSKTKFYNTVSFDSIFTKPTTTFLFKNAILPDTICFVDILNISNEIDLTAANFNDSSRIELSTKNYKENRRHIVYFANSDLSKFHIDYTHFKLLLTDPFKQKKHTSDEAKVIYEGLLKNFKDHGQYDSYELLDIEYHDYLNGTWKFLRWWNCYGYHKEWVFYWIAIFLIFFTLFTFNGIDRLTRTVYSIENIPDLAPIVTYKKSVNKYRLYRRRLWYSFTYTATIFFLLSLKVEKIKFKNKRGVLYLMLIYLAGILCLAYMANYIIQK